MNSYLEQSGKLLKKSSMIFDYNITFSDFCSRLKIRLYTAFCEWKMYIIGENFVQCSFGASTSFMFSSIYSHTLIVFYTLFLLIFLLIYLQIIYILTQTYICIYIQIHMNMPIEFPLTF